MSDSIKHECGIAMIRLLKPLSYYQEKYGTPLYGFNKLFLLMEKQHNRGQDGAGIGAVKLNVPAGRPFMFRDRSIKGNALSTIFGQQLEHYAKMVKSGKIHPEFPDTVKENFDFCAELLIGHLRYGTSGTSDDKSLCHPFFRKSTWPSRNLMLVGNFNITNADALNKKLIERGTHPIFSSDTQSIMEEICYHLDLEHSEIYRKLRDEGLCGEDVLRVMAERLNPVDIIRRAAVDWDGGYTIAGLLGNGDSFVLRDKNGIRPCFYLQNDELIAFASERVALMTIFDETADHIKELEPGHVFLIKGDGSCKNEEYTAAGEKKSCSFERIYFSRGNDPEIYKERKALGAALVPQIIKSVGNDFSKSVFSYIPNTAEMAYYGMMHELRVQRRKDVKSAILEIVNAGKQIAAEDLDRLILDNWPRGEKVVHKDIKLRTFISSEKDRMQMASHVYDITYDVVRPEDALVCLDDSIVRGTTLRQQILRILSRINPRKIVIVSTAPQIRYPDCYGIDMSELGKFIAFQAAVALCKETGKSDLLLEVYQQCCAQADKDPREMKNYVKRIYDCFTDGQISKKIAELVYPTNVSWSGELETIFLSIENLHKAVKSSSGDWFFSGEYPTPGGYKVLNRAYINYFEKKEGRSY
ncbi:MAG: amidophosphoribosyltransferase [Opitutales bacterium]|nr:amidophosphoribosyltransferase [Opitutales bacterium]